MKKYTDKGMKEILKSVNYPQGLSFKQQLKILWWELFNHNKLNLFLDNITKYGLALKEAFNKADFSPSKA